MTQEKRLYRSRDALLGGVCAGVAGYFSVDPLVVRILAVVLAAMSCGAVAIAYVALCAVLPRAPKTVKPVEVQPEAVHSEAFGTVDCEWACGRRAASGVPGAPASPGASGAFRRGSVAHEAAGRYASSFGSAAQIPPIPPAAVGATCPVPKPLSEEDVMRLEPHGASFRAVVLALVAGCTLLVAGIASVITACVAEVSWWQCWPLAVMVAGVVRMAIPARLGLRMAAFMGGLITVCFGAVLLSMSFELVSWATLVHMAVDLWPAFLLAAMISIAGCACRLPVLTFMGTALALFLLIGGAVAFAEPGAVRELAVAVPYGKEYTLLLHP